MRSALITGVTGQDGWYLSEYLHGLGYKVYGLVRRCSQDREIPPGVEVIEGEITEPMRGLPDEVNEVYHLAAMSHVGHSFDVPATVLRVNTLGTLNALEYAKARKARFYQASTSELFGGTPAPQDEKSQFHPRSPYGVAKLAAYWLTVNYREAYGLHASNGILFNHESPRRGADFVTQKICRGVAAIVAGKADKLVLGNLSACRDWGHAADYVRGMHLMVSQDKPGDYVLATGVSRTVGEFVAAAFNYAGIRDYQRHVETSEKYYRPAEVNALRGNPSKIEALGWNRKYGFMDLVEEMMEGAYVAAGIEHMGGRRAQRHTASGG